MPIELDKYRLHRRVARGGMAEIFLAHPLDAVSRDEAVAIKRIRPEFARDSSFVQMFMDEARISCHLNHPNIANLIDWGMSDGVPFLVMEFIAGVDLALFLKQFTLPMQIVAEIGIAVAEALDHAHRQCDGDGQPLGIVHRDVTPHNVMLTFDGQVKLLDFGIALARVRAERTQTGIMKGKWCYMSPEQIAGQPLDRRSDIFSVGTLMYEMLTQVRAFHRTSPAATLRAITSEAPVPIFTLANGTPPEFVEIIDRCLAKDPSNRFQSAQEVAEELKNILYYYGPAEGNATLESIVLSSFPERAVQVTTVLTELELSMNSDGYDYENDLDSMDQTSLFVRTAADLEPYTPPMGVERVPSECPTIPSPMMQAFVEEREMRVASISSLSLVLLAVMLGLVTGVGLMYTFWFIST